MKKTLVLALTGLAMAASSSYGQGYIVLDNYTSASQPLVTFGAGSGGALGAGLNTAGWTVGVYFAQGDISASVLPDPVGNADPTSLNPLLLLGTGLGSSAAVYTSTFNSAGLFFTGTPFQASAAAGSTVTAMIVAYNGADYATSDIKGHSTAFTLATQGATAVPPTALVGNFMSSFSVVGIPEPSTLALAGLGIAGLMAFRRRS